PGFPTLLKRIASLWKEDSEKLKKSGMDVIDMLRNAFGTNDSGKSEPKFPTPVQFHFLLRYYYYIYHEYELSDESLSNLSISQIHAKGNQLGIDFKDCFEKSDCIQKLQKAVANRQETAQKALEMVKFTLMKIARGGIHDHVGSGFHRYSTDRYWHVPHFEKMLYDQAQLLATCIEIFLLTKEEYFAEIARDIINYVKRDLRDPVGGGFYSAEDADSYPYEGATHKLEGAFAVWETSELDQILGEDSTVFCYHFGVKEKGNVPREKDIQGELINKNVLIERYTLEETAKEFSLSLDTLDQIIKRCKEKLAKHRAEKRPKPHRDDKVLTAWN
ncbi:314_t:CDS:10, partial [Ambispora leptoticha]